ncbi:MAG: biotin--[acetyl-CoA-carboxylase] ligase [Deltaproteobacteria bacterium]|nr:biotin--[acetyl-CoA-carboxylase] ligase [Deltaproteobacteria bacterium]
MKSDSSTSGDPFSEAGLRKVIEAHTLGRGLIEIHDEIGSTNQRARELAMAGAPEGTLILAEYQTAGRGRLGRTWHSPPGLNIYMSLILTPDLALNRTPLLTLAAGLAGSEAISRVTGQKPLVKWPNDLILKDRKVAGILSEMEVQDASVRFVVLGVGINVNLAASDLPEELKDLAGSLRIATGRIWDRGLVLAAFLSELEKYYELLRQDRRDELLGKYRRVCQNIGRRVRFDRKGILIEGRAVDLDLSGRLLVEQDKDGRIVPVTSGDVSLLRQNTEK